MQGLGFWCLMLGKAPVYGAASEEASGVVRGLATAPITFGSLFGISMFIHFRRRWLPG